MSTSDVDYQLLNKMERQPSFSNFDCGDLFLDSFAPKKLAKADANNDSRVYVAVDRDIGVGFATMKVFMLSNDEHSILSGKYPRQVPVVMLDQIAVDKAYQGKGIGKRLMRKVMEATVLVNELAAAKGLALWAHPRAKDFYISLGFDAIPDATKQVQDVELALMFIHVETILDALK
ncbi:MULTISPECIES: GNAT family N-acetyltransferase [Shewanella]|uniref:GNAT family N-acetyltransferase n=1 Tax=Shewanella TaxID=22 RepID=UPI001BAF115B|nr:MULTISPECIES: GNAT family N-acetyltransferase [Shewanella]MBS0043827.1 GNAT family N-acetyltransferase [Shewanella sp. M16]MCS6193002.1 GNAT family N-acetyltransferase [Shewanella baltica]MCS6232558.1 GNAT family N-acetyltransferase [Shewanella baltica]MCS6241745.1 GNAT family N-acetyltransferase [Shewanella baltica]